MDNSTDWIPVAILGFTLFVSVGLWIIDKFFDKE